MVQLSLATGINASTPQRFQLVPQPRPYTGNPVSGGLGGVAGLVNPLLFGSIRPNNSLLQVYPQFLLPQLFVDSIYGEYKSNVDLSSLNQLSNWNAIGTFSNLVNRYVFRTLTLEGAEPHWPDGPSMVGGGDRVNDFRMKLKERGSWVIPYHGSQAGQNYPSDGAVILP